MPNPEEQLARLLEEFIAAEARQTEIDLDEFLGRFPQELREEGRLRCNQYLRHARLLGDARAAPSREPTRLGKYRVIRTLGSGALATVYLGEHVDSGETVALKVLLPERASRPVNLERFRREFQVGSEVRHPHLVHLSEIGEEDGFHYIVMSEVLVASLAEVIAGDTNNSEPRNDPPKINVPHRQQAEWLPWALGLVVDVCGALQALHDANYIHRDVKPHNILLNAEGRAYLADFGLARWEETLAGELTLPGQPLGTPYYMSPEQVLARRYAIDARTDVYSLGVVLYELLTKQHPHSGSTVNEVMYEISFTPPRAMSELQKTIPFDLDTICLKALEKSPKHRYATAAEFAADIERFLKLEAVSARRTPLLRRCRYWIRARPVVSTVGVVIGIILLSTLATWLVVEWNLYNQRLAAMSRLTVRGATDAEIFTRQLQGGNQYGPVVRMAGRERVPFEQGYYRVIVWRDAENHASIPIVMAEKGREYVLEPRLRSNADTLPGMIRYPRSTTTLGFSKARREAFQTRPITVAAFAMDPYETTVGEYKEYIDAVGTENAEIPWAWEKEGDPLGSFDPAWSKLPMTGISWLGASRYAAWAGKRLPTYWEWESVARGSGGAEFPPQFNAEDPSPFGIDLRPLSSALTPEQVFIMNIAHLRPVGTFPIDVSPDGRVFDLFSNVREMVEGAEVVDHDGSETLDVLIRLSKGNSWADFGLFYSDRVTFAVGTSFELPTTGFRCARSIDPLAED